MHMITAITIVVIEPEMVLDMRVYHSGIKRYTAVTKSRMGIQNNAAIGKPASNFVVKLFCSSRTLSQ